MNSPDMRNALTQVALAIGMKSAERLASQLDPDIMMEQAAEMIRTELKEAFQGILGDSENSWTSDLIDRLYQDLDADQVIERIAEPLAKAMADYFKQETSELVDAIVNQLDFDELIEKVADKVAARVQIG